MRNLSKTPDYILINLETKTFSMPKLKELQCHKLRPKLPL